MFTLVKTSLVHSPFPRCQQLQRIVICSAGSDALSGPADSWPTLVSEPSEVDRLRPRENKRKRMRIAGVEQDELLDPWLLADPDSCFAELYGVKIHYKIASEDKEREEQTSGGTALEKETGFPKDEAFSDMRESSSTSSSAIPPSLSQASSMPSSISAILLHGFGASLFSWERVMKRLANALQASVIAFDRPAFGLTSRIKVPLGDSDNPSHIPMNPYSIAFSSTATIGFMDLFQASKAILIGHSAGCIVAADAYFKAPERIAALVLVAPAIIAPLVLKKKVEARREKSTMTEAFLNIGERIGCIFRKITAVIQRILSSINQLWRHLLAAALRSDFSHWLIRIIMDKFSLRAVRLAWYNKDKVDEYVISGYTKPLRCRDWEHALLEYVIALIEGPSTNDINVPVSQRLDQIECPVLIISGDSDALVPAWNAERLSKVLPNAQCHIIKNCGHLPQEETPEEFLSMIQMFIHQIQLGVFQERNSQGIMSDSPA